MHHYLVTTFNHKKFLPAMLDSIRAQYATLSDFHAEARVLVVDDVSSDGTRSLLRELEKKHPNFEVHLNQVNQGIGRNRNFLLNWLTSRPLADSDFVLFVDGDDVLPSNHNAIKLASFEQEPHLECVGGQLRLFFEDGSPECTVDTFSTDPDIQAIANIFECHFYVSNAMFRGHVFKDPKVRFPETPLAEDWMFFSMFPLAKRHARGVTLRYRRHSANLTSTDALPAQRWMELRTSARVFGLLPLGIHPTTAECQLLDLVGYHSFQNAFHGSTCVPRPDCQMPWFRGMSVDDAKAWPKVRLPLAAFFDRMVESNGRIQAYHPAKLRAFLDGMLARADELCKATVMRELVA